MTTLSSAGSRAGLALAAGACAIAWLTPGGGPDGQTSPSPLTAVATIPLPGVSGRIDHLAFDKDTARLFVAALGNDTVEVVDTLKAARVRSVTGFHKPQGMAVVPEPHAVAVSNGGTGTLQLLDAQTLQVLWTADIGGDADNVRYDAVASRLYVAAEGGLFAVDPANGRPAGRMAIDGHPESFQLETTGSRVYANLPGSLGGVLGGTQVVAGDRTTMKAVAEWSACGANYPMALDEPGRRLFIGCRRPASVAMLETMSGKTVTSTATVGDTDDLFYDAERRQVYVIGGEGAIDVFSREADALRRIGRTSTRDGARTGLWVASQRRLYVAVPKRSGAAAEIRVFEAR